MVPSYERLRSLLHRVRRSGFSLFTRTEQDVLDAEFDTERHCSHPGDATCVGHAYFSLGFVQSVVYHHKLHAGIYEDSSSRDTGWQDQVLKNLTCSLCYRSSLSLQQSLVNQRGDGLRRSVEQCHTKGPLELQRAVKATLALSPLLASATLHNISLDPYSKYMFTRNLTCNKRKGAAQRAESARNIYESFDAISIHD
ncbi:MAG: hypothetical protein SGPRY_009097 [Prymnesium sp.]